MFLSTVAGDTASTVAAGAAKQPRKSKAAEKALNVDGKQLNNAYGKPRNVPRYEITYQERFATDEECNWRKLLPMKERESLPALQQTRSIRLPGGRIRLPSLIGPNHELNTEKTMQQINPGISELKVPFYSEWKKMSDEDREDFTKKYEALSVTQKIKAVANMVSRAYDEVEQMEKPDKKLVGGGFYPPPIQVATPIVVMKASMKVSAYDICAHYNLSLKQYDIVKQIVGPRFNPEDASITLVSDDKKLSNEKHKMKLEKLLEDIVEEAKKAEEEIRSGSSKITIADIAKKDAADLHKKLSEELNNIIAEEQKKSAAR